jgi:hypothetical protein
MWIDNNNNCSDIYLNNDHIIGFENVVTFYHFLEHFMKNTKVFIYDDHNNFDNVNDLKDVNSDILYRIYINIHFSKFSGVKYDKRYSQYDATTQSILPFVSKLPSKSDIKYGEHLLIFKNYLGISMFFYKDCMKYHNIIIQNNNSLSMELVKSYNTIINEFKVYINLSNYHLNGKYISSGINFYLIDNYGNLYNTIYDYDCINNANLKHKFLHITNIMQLNHMIQSSSIGITCESFYNFIEDCLNIKNRTSISENSEFIKINLFEEPNSFVPKINIVFSKIINIAKSNSIVQNVQNIQNVHNVHMCTSYYPCK